MSHYKGASRKHEIRTHRRRKDTRPFTQKFTEFFDSGDGVVLGIFILPIIALLLIKVPLSGELMLLVAWLYQQRFIRTNNRAYDFPYRVPVEAHLYDGSIKGGKAFGEGIAYLGNELETKEQIYASNIDLRAHMLILGTTGSGKTEFLLSIVFNALVLNTGFIYVDGKGDPKLQKEIFRLARFLGREDDLLITNFITSGRDFVEKQTDKVTNNMNLMSNVSSGMLIELLVSLMDDAGSGDMWKGRAISFVAALTRPLIYMRDKGFINLSSDKYLEYFELNIIEDLVWEHNGRYGETFDVIVAPLRTYLVTLPGYQKAKIKKQEQKTLEQHGFIVMQLTRIFNDLTFNYGHIFKSRVGDVDFFDVVINRRLLVVLLPALERAPDSLRMLGKMIVGSVKQMMAGCLGNRVEGVIREIIDSRPTNAAVPFPTILDEYGYYAVLGFAVAPAQARSLGFSVIFAAQDFSSLKKSSAEEADATWENTNVRVIGRITSGQESETWRRIHGAAGETQEAMMQGFKRQPGAMDDQFHQQDHVVIERRNRLDYDDLAMQEQGEFTFLIGKKERGGQFGGVRVIRAIGFHTAGKNPKEMRINDLIPIDTPEPADLPQNRRAVEALMKSLVDGSFTQSVKGCIKGDPILVGFHQLFGRNNRYSDAHRLSKMEASFAVLGWYLSGRPQIVTTAHHPTPPQAPSPQPDLSQIPNLHQIGIEKVLAEVSATIVKQPKLTTSAYTTAIPVKLAEEEDEITISAKDVATNFMATNQDRLTFREKALPILRQHLFMMDELPHEDEWENQLDIAQRDLLIGVELAATQQSFDSLEEKWALEARIQKTHESIATQTAYPVPPILSSVNIETAQKSLSVLAEQCQALLQKSFQNDESESESS